MFRNRIYKALYEFKFYEDAIFMKYNMTSKVIEFIIRSLLCLKTIL